MTLTSDALRAVASIVCPPCVEFAELSGTVTGLVGFSVQEAVNAIATPDANRTNNRDRCEQDRRVIVLPLNG